MKEPPRREDSEVRSKLGLGSLRDCETTYSSLGDDGCLVGMRISETEVKVWFAYYEALGIYIDVPFWRNRRMINFEDKVWDKSREIENAHRSRL